jgi:hypothetical protein
VTWFLVGSAFGLFVTWTCLEAKYRDDIKTAREERDLALMTIHAEKVRAAMWRREADALRKAASEWRTLAEGAVWER